MARSHGRILASIWTDDDFLALDSEAQRLYLFLLSQPDLSHAGLVPLRSNRWARKVATTSPEEIEGTLALLQEKRFVVVDLDTEEVLVRTFVRNDGVYKQPKVMVRLREDAKQIESKTLRKAFREELDRLPLHELSDKPGGPGGDHPSTQETVAGIVDTLRADFSDVSEYPSERVSDTPHAGAGAFPQPPTPYPQPPATVPLPPTAGSALAPRDDREPDAQVLVAEWIEHCPDRPPGRVIGQVAKELKSMLTEGIDPARVRAGLAEWNSRGLHPSSLPSVVHELSTPQRRPGRQKETDDIFSRAAVRMGVIQGGQQ